MNEILNIVHRSLKNAKEATGKENYHRFLGILEIYRKHVQPQLFVNDFIEHVLISHSEKSESCGAAGVTETEMPG